jgi:hypothetical protein
MKIPRKYGFSWDFYSFASFQCSKLNFYENTQGIKNYMDFMKGIITPKCPIHIRLDYKLFPLIKYIRQTHFLNSIFIQGFHVFPFSDNSHFALIELPSSLAVRTVLIFSSPNFKTNDFSKTAYIVIDSP